MATLPASSDATTSTATEGQVKTWLAAVRTYIAQQLGAAGTQAESLTTLGAPFNSAISKTGDYTVVAADRGKVIRCTGTWTLSVTAVATLGDGFLFAVLNEGAGVITLDPNLTETVDGATTKALTAGSFTVFYCDGTKIKSMGSIDSAAVIAALGYTPANSTHTHSTYVSASMTTSGTAMPIGWFGHCTLDGATVAANATTAGGNVIAPNTATQPGTWKNINGASIPNGSGGQMQRIS